MSRKILAFCGKQGSGKGYSCQRLIMTKGFKKISFADPLRCIAFKVIGIPYEEGMKQYAELKQKEIVNGLTFRNILENLGSGVRKYDKDFWVKAALEEIKSTGKNICIDDLRYYNEYEILKNYSLENNIDFKLVFCDYHSEFYEEDNPHESAALAKYLKDLGYRDQQYVEDIDMQTFSVVEESPRYLFDETQILV